MEMKQKECGIVCKENGTEQIGKITEEEWRLLKQYRNLCEENKLTINILKEKMVSWNWFSIKFRNNLRVNIVSKIVTAVCMAIIRCMDKDL